MKKLIGLSALVLTAVVAIAHQAAATTTWSVPATIPTEVQASQVVVTGTSSSAPTLATDGFALRGTPAYMVSIEVNIPSQTGPDAGSGNWDASVYVQSSDANAVDCLGASCKVLAFLWNPATRLWYRDPPNDITPTPGFTRYAITGVSLGSPLGRVAYVPSACEVPVKIVIAK